MFATGDAADAAITAARGKDLLDREFSARPAYAVEQLAKLATVHARALAASEKPDLAVEGLVGEIVRIAPYYRQRPRALIQPMRDIVNELMALAPERVAREVPPDMAALTEWNS